MNTQNYSGAVKYSGPPDTNPGYRGGSIIKASLPVQEIVDGVLVRGTCEATLLKNVMIRYANPVKPMKTDPTRVFGYAYGRYEPGRGGNVGITGFDELAPIISALQPGQIVSFVGRVNYREGRRFFEVQRVVQTGAPPQAPVAAAAAEPEPAKKARKPRAAAAAAAAPAVAEPPTAAEPFPDEPSF